MKRKDSGKAVRGTGNTERAEAGDEEKQAGVVSWQEAVGSALRKMTEQIQNGDLKPNIADFTRLIQLQSEFENSRPKEIVAGWIGTEEMELVSGE